MEKAGTWYTKFSIMKNTQIIHDFSLYLLYSNIRPFPFRGFDISKYNLAEF